MARQKYIFLYALILTIIVFNVGIFLGYKMESLRINKINSMYLESEIELLDQMTQKSSIETIGLNCSLLAKENIDFGDRIFEEAKTIQKYEDANRINSDIIIQHKRFDALRYFSGTSG